MSTLYDDLAERLRKQIERDRDRDYDIRWTGMLGTFSTKPMPFVLPTINTDEETTMESTTMCEACGGTDRVTSIQMAQDIGKAVVCHRCRTEVACGPVDREIRNRRRSRPAAELEALEFVALRDYTLAADGCAFRVRLRRGMRVRFEPDRPGDPFTCWTVTSHPHEPGCCGPSDLPRIHAELCQLRDTPAPQAGSGFKVGDRVRKRYRHANGFNKDGNWNGTVTTVTPEFTVTFDGGCFSGDEAMPDKAADYELIPPSEDPKRQPEASPLERDIECCTDCGASPAIERDYAYDPICTYCSDRVALERIGAECTAPFGKPELASRIASVAPKEAERREVWDWDCWSTPGAES